MKDAPERRMDPSQTGGTFGGWAPPALEGWIRMIPASVLTGVFLLLLAGAAGDALADTSCIDCHLRVTPGIVKQHLDGKMSKKGVDCSTCHGSDHRSMDDAARAKMPTPETCIGCHRKQVDQFRAGKHDLAWTAVVSLPLMGHQTKAVAGEGYKGCTGCHKIGAKSGSERQRYRYGNAQCDSCHTRHAFRKSEAQDPRACQTCHMGFDHPHWEMWSTSKHGTIWQIEGRDSARAPTCQRCHLNGGDHRVMTAWGFLALRLPEDDKGWLEDRVTILQALGVLDDRGNPAERFGLVKAARLARLTKEEFDGERERMLQICSECHGRDFAKTQLNAADIVVRDADKIFAQAVREVRGLYEDGVLRKPADWTFAPDLLQFYEAKTTIEQDLYLMFMGYRMRSFQGAFHMNPDYMHWYGWAPLKETLQRIRDEAGRLRTGQGRP